MTKALVSAFALSLALAAPALAQTAPSTDPAQAKSGTYKTDPNHALIEFTVLHFGLSNYHGSFGGVTGTLSLDAAAPEKSQVEVHVPMSSVFVQSAKLVGELNGDKWFDVAKFPEAVFKSTKVTVTGKGSATIAGDLTLHGVTKPVTLDAKFIAAGDNPFTKVFTVGFEATTKINRGDFGVSFLSPIIADMVDVTISVPFERQN